MKNGDDKADFTSRREPGPPATALLAANNNSVKNGRFRKTVPSGDSFAPFRFREISAVGEFFEPGILTELTPSRDEVSIDSQTLAGKCRDLREPPVDRVPVERAVVYYF
jgi:hypothetical protein